MGHLIPVPHVAVQLLWACQGDIFSPQDLHKIILQDSAFCAKILNAAVKSCPERIDPAAPLSSALKGLSLSVIQSLAIQSAKRLVETRFTAAQIQFMRELWFYSQVGSITAGFLAEAISYPDPEEAQVAGLLLNVGMLTLFSKNPKQYLNEIGSSLVCKEVRERERTIFASDHLQVADALISGWQFESFMADAISFLDLDIDQCRESSPLIRIVRLSLEICKSPFALNDEILSVAGKLFAFTKVDTEYIFKLAQGQYRSLSPFSGNQKVFLKEFNQVQKRLTAVVFSIADQEAIRSQLANSDRIEAFVGTARHLYLQNSAAQDAVFFAVDPQNSRLSGLPASEQTRLVTELTTPLSAGSLLAEALLDGKTRHSFERENMVFSAFDRQLIRLCKGRGIVCIPLLEKGELLGGIALGIENASEAQSFTTPQMQLLNGSIAKALAALTTAQTELPKAEFACAEADLIPKLVHEVSNPLTIINNYISVVGTLLEGSGNGEILPAIENEIKRIGEILNYYTELKDTPQPPDAEIALNELILSVVESLRLTFFTPKEIEIQTDFDPSLRCVKTKSVAVKQIMVNLLKNAAEALDKGGRISLTTREQRRSDGRHTVDIGVRDNGPGIDKQIQQRLFSPVSSTKGGKHVGLGLNIVKGMVDDIGAKISCHSSAEFGTSFNLVIPIIDE